MRVDRIITYNLDGDLFVCGRAVALTEEERAVVRRLAAMGPAARQLPAACVFCGGDVEGPVACCTEASLWVGAITREPSGPVGRS